jgi:hypothetical protein
MVRLASRRKMKPDAATRQPSDRASAESASVDRLERMTLAFPFARAFLRKRSGWIGLGMAGLYFLLMAVLSFKYHKIGDYGVETDFYVFVSQAKQILQGGFPIDGARGPIYFLLLAAAGLFTSDFFHAGLLIGLISAAVVIYFTFRLLGLLYGEDVALIVTLLTASSPVFVQHTYSCGTDMFFFAIAAGAIYYYLKQSELGHGHLIVAGILAGLAYLTRYNGVVIVLGLAAGLLLFDSGRLAGGRRLSGLLLLAAAFALAITPWGLYCLREKGDFFYNTNYRNIAYGIYGEGHMDWDAFWGTRANDFRSFMDVFREGPGLFAKTIVVNIYNHFASDMRDLLGWHTGILVLPGVLITLLRRPDSRQAVYLLLNALFFGVLLTVFYNPRFSMFLVPVYGLMAVQTVSWAGSVLSRRSGIVSRLVPAAALLLVMWTAAEAFQFNKENISKGPKEILIIADWFNKNVPGPHKEEVIVARKPQIAYYLGMDFKWIPDVKQYDELMADLKAMDADYLYFSYLEAHWRPELAFLLNAEEEYPGLRPVIFMKNPGVVLYKVVD